LFSFILLNVCFSSEEGLECDFFTVYKDSNHHTPVQNCEMILIREVNYLRNYNKLKKLEKPRQPAPPRSRVQS